MRIIAALLLSAGCGTGVEQAALAQQVLPDCVVRRVPVDPMNPTGATYLAAEPPAANANQSTQAMNLTAAWVMCPNPPPVGATVGCTMSGALSAPTATVELSWVPYVRRTGRYRTDCISPQGVRRSTDYADGPVDPPPPAQEQCVQKCVARAANTIATANSDSGTCANPNITVVAETCQQFQKNLGTLGGDCTVRDVGANASWNTLQRGLVNVTWAAGPETLGVVDERGACLPTERGYTRQYVNYYLVTNAATACAGIAPNQNDCPPDSAEAQAAAATALQNTFVVTLAVRGCAADKAPPK